MFKLNLNSEDILMKITVAKFINNKDVITNFLGNLLTRAGGDIADKVNIILTNDTLYLEYIGHAAIGYAEEVRDLEKIALKDLKGFSVISNENEELIKILREKATYNADASRGRALKARVKIQERLEANRIKHPFVDIKQPYINLETNNEIEEEIIALKTDNLGISFDEVLLQNVNFEIKSNDKVAIIGTNGVGKTTLLKQIFKNNNDAIKIDENIKLAYLSQMQSEVVNESNTILQEFYDIGFETYGEIRRYLGRYGFSSDILTQKIESLSGGEKNILQLAKVSASKANMLLMDEPTSHLDIYSQMALEKAISNYKGAILMISHDYHFIVNCADYVLLIEDKTIRKMSMRKFRKMIYANHFDKDYLQIEEKKKALEMDIASSLRDTDFERARSLSEKLEEIIKSL